MIQVKLSKLEASRSNPRRVKPEREAHRRLVASIRAHGLLEPLVVRPTGERGQYRVIAGNRRLAALREVYSGQDPLVECVAREAGEAEAGELSLAENFAREPMHPLDEAEAFARQASVDCKGVSAVASDFGVSAHYVRQRIRLADLAEPVKEALRLNQIGIGVAEAFSAVPPGRQVQLWQEVGGQPRTADQVRRMIEAAWIPAEHALFDTGELSPDLTSHDLFGDNVLIEREVFMLSQTQALEGERVRLLEQGWARVEIVRNDEWPEQMPRMAVAEGSYDAVTAEALAEIAARRECIEGQEPTDEAHERRLTDELDALDERERDVIEKVTLTYSEGVKAVGTMFLRLCPDGRVERLARVPQETRAARAQSAQSIALPTCDELSEPQRATLRTHEFLAVRAALAADPLAVKRVLVILLHDRVERDAVAIRRHPHGAAHYAESTDGFRSVHVERHRARRSEVDPLGPGSVSEVEAYELLKGLTEAQLDSLIGILAVECLTASLQAPTPLVTTLREELGVCLREHWTPDAAWLGGYRKAQLAELLGRLRTPENGAAALGRRKSELVADLATTFEKATVDHLDGDSTTNGLAGAWLPAEFLPPGTSERPTPR